MLLAALATLETSDAEIPVEVESVMAVKLISRTWLLKATAATMAAVTVTVATTTVTMETIMVGMAETRAVVMAVIIILEMVDQSRTEVVRKNKLFLILESARNLKKFWTLKLPKG